MVPPRGWVALATGAARYAAVSYDASADFLDNESPNA